MNLEDTKDWLKRFSEFIEKYENAEKGELNDLENYKEYLLNEFAEITNLKNKIDDYEDVILYGFFKDKTDNKLISEFAEDYLNKNQLQEYFELLNNQ